MNKLFDFDKKNNENKILIGTDEAGRGPLAGPVVAAAVYFPNLTKSIIEKLEMVNDSKKLSEKQRECLYELIKDNSIYSIKLTEVEEIEQINILQASLKTMKLACEDVISKTKGDVLVFVDGNKKIPNFIDSQKTIVKGDATSASVASASILAKVYRDKLMKNYSETYTEYDFQNNKGYGTAKHIEAIKKFGVTPIHRKTFLKKIFEKENIVQMTLDI